MPTIYVENRDKLPKRKEFDFYPTPIELCKVAVRKLDLYVPHITILDPGAGNGVWGKAIREVYPEFSITIGGVEIRDVGKPDSYTNWYNNIDFLTWNPNYKYDLIVGNPPYKYAEEFLDKSFELLKDNGQILFLYRLTFLESLGRYKKYFSGTLAPEKVYVSTRRISFSGNKKSSSDAYALFYWRGFNNIYGTELGWLDWNYE